VKEIRVCTQEVLENGGSTYVADALNERITIDPVQIQSKVSGKNLGQYSPTCDVDELSSGIYNLAVFRVLDCKEDDIVTIPKLQVRRNAICCVV
jgi:hypothetical protein